jgi:hypothetical protein
MVRRNCDAGVTKGYHTAAADRSRDGHTRVKERTMRPLDGVRILVMDRSLRRGRSACRLLEIWGATVSLAGTATAACAAALAFRPEVIVSGAGFASAEWHPVVRLLGDAPPAVLVWKETAPPEAVADLALRLYAGSRR